jgi:hypothetical protein
VPALACLAAAPLATAADSTSVKIDGFVDSILSGYSKDLPASGADSNTSFTFGAKLGMAVTISEKVSAQVDIVANTGASSATDKDTAKIKQAYGTWKINDTVSLKTGKFIGNIGWVAAYSPGLYRVNAGPIVALYSTDSVGADLAYAAGDLTVTFGVVNGLFDSNEVNGAGQSDLTQKDQSFAYLAEATYALADKMGTVNVELGYDTESNDGVAGEGGDALHLAVNATLTPSEPVTIGAELIAQAFDANSAQNLATNDDQSKLGLLAMVNYKLGSALPVPASVTGMIQYVSIDGDGYVKDATDETTEIAVALLTNPAGTDKLGANLELNYITGEVDGADEEYAIGLSAEILYVF